MSFLALLTDPSLTIIFATSPTGLGHLRVTDALYHGLPKTVSPILLGAQDPSVSFLYRFICIHPLTRQLMEWTQMPPLDKPFAALTRYMVRSRTKLLYQQLKTILSERITVPKTVLLVATITTLGHQLGAIKKQLEREMEIKVLLVVQVTDDSPQAIWYVYDADMIFVPSYYTKEHLLIYAKKNKLPIVPIVVTAYPINPLLTVEISDHVFANRCEQVNPRLQSAIHVSIPVSGAAIGTSFMSKFIQTIHTYSKRFMFHVVSREAPYTQSFIRTMSQLNYVKLYTSIHDRTTVDNYESVFDETSIALEMTKPSEQSFKVLMTPKQRGGAIILFSSPVGGQEYDNLHYLRNHGFIPSNNENHLLWQKALNQENIHDAQFFAKVRQWRGLLLPNDPKIAAQFTVWCLQKEIFSTMMQYKNIHTTEETGSNGVEQFWTHVSQLIEKKHG